MRPDTASLVAPLPEVVPSTQAAPRANDFNQPIAHEVHLGSWRRHTDNHYETATASWRCSLSTM